MEELSNHIMELKGILIMSCITVTLIILYASRRISRSRLGKRHSGIWYLTCGLSGRQQFHTGMLYLSFVSTLGLLLYPEELTGTHAAEYAICLSLCIVSAQDSKDRAYLLVNGGILATGILVVHALLSYARLLRSDSQYLVLYALGTLCLLLYAAYTMLYVFLRMCKKGQNRATLKNEKDFTYGSHRKRKERKTS